MEKLYNHHIIARCTDASDLEVNATLWSFKMNQYILKQLMFRINYYYAIWCSLILNFLVILKFMSLTISLKHRRQVVIDLKNDLIN